MLNQKNVSFNNEYFFHLEERSTALNDGFYIAATPWGVVNGLLM